LVDTLEKINLTVIDLLNISIQLIATGIMLITMIPMFGNELKNEANSTEVTIIDFSNTSTSYWQIVNDNVMGGISRSAIEMDKDGFAVFSGTVSLENNGGFASMRTQARSPADLSEFEGLSVRVFGDGKTYSLRLRTVKNGRITPYSYEARFTTSGGEWETHKLPYRDFRAVFRGNSVRGNPELNSDAIIEIGFMIQDRQTGPFSLSISGINVYR